jgi:galactokinase
MRISDDHPADVRAFAEYIGALSSGGGAPQLADFFTSDRPLWLARAPGGLDVMGGIAEYSGSLVLQLPLAKATLAAVQAADDDHARIASLPATGFDHPRRFAIGLDDLRVLIRGTYDQSRAWFRNHDPDPRAAYVAAALIVLARHQELEIDGGLRLLIHSHVPEGKGVRSSAALEVAAMQALAHHFGIALSGVQLAHLCQEAENRVVGVACGVMDQMTAAVGHRDQLLALLCQPAEVLGSVAIPETIRCWGIDAGIRHAVSGSDYSSVRTGAFMGYRILAELAGLEVTAPDAHGLVRVVDPLWRGYLANVTPAEWEQFADRMPGELSGAEFLARYGGTTDPVTRVDPARRYAVADPTEHPIREHDRVRRFAALLAGPLSEAALEEMGQLMYRSHDSYSACGLGSPETDLLVQMVRTAGPAGGVYGAKITGVGRGGTVAVLAAADAGPVVQDIAARYARRSGRQATIFSGSSSGACNFGALRLNAP